MLWSVSNEESMFDDIDIRAKSGTDTEKRKSEKLERELAVANEKSEKAQRELVPMLLNLFSFDTIS